jgi:hypothetical protein
MSNIQITITAATQPRIVMPTYAFGVAACADARVRTHVSALKGGNPGTSVWSPPTS